MSVASLGCGSGVLAVMKQETSVSSLAVWQSIPFWGDAGGCYPATRQMLVPVRENKQNHNPSVVVFQRQAGVII